MTLFFTFLAISLLSRIVGGVLLFLVTLRAVLSLGGAPLLVITATPYWACSDSHSYSMSGMENLLLVFLATGLTILDRLLSPCCVCSSVDGDSYGRFRP